MTRALAGLALALALLAPAPRPVHAADPPGDAAGYQAKVELFLKHTDPAALERVLKAWEQTGVGKWDYFALPFFKEGAFTGSGTSGAPAEGQAANTAVMKVLSKPRWAGVSRQLARMRWAMLVDLWTDVAVDNMVRIELIDSDRRDAACATKATPETCGRRCSRYTGITAPDDKLGGMNACHRGVQDRENK